jgi:hypothetical protein
MIKSYTDITQSKKLAEILPLESADMMYHSVETEYGSGAFVATSKVITNGLKNDDFYLDDIPCWSLASLLNGLPDYTLQTNTDGTVFVVCESKKPMISDSFSNPVDACVAMIENLHKLNLL